MNLGLDCPIHPVASLQYAMGTSPTILARPIPSAPQVKQILRVVTMIIDKPLSALDLVLDTALRGVIRLSTVLELSLKTVRDEACEQHVADQRKYCPRERPKPTGLRKFFTSSPPTMFLWTCSLSSSLGMGSRTCHWTAYMDV